MTAVISREHTRAACLAGAAGGLLIAIAFVMMIVAAPGHGAIRGAGPTRGLTQPAVTQVIADVCHRFTSRSDSAMARACLAGPSAASA
jgi:hypothetical protein